jgi:hypothetical protein
METFWKWLMRTNARMVFLVALIALVLVSGWWWWKLSHPLPYKEIKMASTPRTRPHVGLGIDNIFSEEQKKMQPETTNPFDAENIEFYYMSLTPPEKPVPPVSTGTPPVQPPPRKPPITGKEPKPSPVYLTYKGLFQRTDGKITALIENSRSKQSEFYEAGQEVFGLKINEIGMEQISLTNDIGVEVIIKRGVPWELKKNIAGMKEKEP